MSPSLKNEALEVFRAHDVVEISEPVLEDDTVRPNRSSDVPRAPTILCAGRLCRQKDFMTAIRAFARIADQTTAQMIILGEGPLRKNLERELFRANLSDRVSMPGHVSDIQSYMKDADLFLMTSHYEGYPAVLIEAMASGLPIVTTNCSLAMSEIMELRSLGCVVNSRDPGDIGTAILEQLKRPMPDAGVSSSIIERHRIGAASAAYLDLFDSLVA